ncbi:transposase [Myxococcus xanthus]|uniref:transposase n=1 Tax=Myxococcus xanthus TaxID=34 RepID=UPI00112841E1|nr:transposase [Myxococcus xanthus]
MRRTWAQLSSTAGGDHFHQRATLKPLPTRPYQLAFWKKARMNIDYHVELEGHWYSVPYTLVGNPVEVRHTEGCVEAFLAGRRVASHVRSAQPGRFSTQPEHMPAPTGSTPSGRPCVSLAGPKAWTPRARSWWRNS